MRNKTIIKKQNKIEITDIFIFMIIICAFGFALLSFFPGLVTSDNVDQINQSFTNNYKPAHPVIHSFLIGNLTKMGGQGAIWIPALFQILFFAISWTYFCKKCREYNKSIKNKIFQIIITGIISIIPLNFLYSITLWKDIIYSYNFIILLTMIYLGIKSKYNYTAIQLILLTLSCVSIMKFRYNGSPIGLIMFFIVGILILFYQKSAKKILIYVISFLIFFVILSMPAKIFVHTTEESSGTIFDTTRVYCMGALLNTDIYLEDDEIEFLNTILDVNIWKEQYNAYSGSPIFYNENYNAKALEKAETHEKLGKIFKKYAKQKPFVVIKHFLDVNSMWWSIYDFGNAHNVILNNGSVSDMSNGIYDNKPITQKGNNILFNYTCGTLYNKVKNIICYRPAVVINISFAIIICLILKHKKTVYTLLILPMLLNIGTYVFIMSSQDLRYFYPCFITAYMLVIIFGNEIIKNKKIVKDKSREKINNPKTLIIVPAYNEEGAIKKTVDTIYKENQNCDVVVINDGSIDNTIEEARKTKAIVIDSINNLGIGGAVQTGYLYAYKNNYDIAIQVDGDGQHNPKYIQNMIEILSNENVDMVIGSRFIEKTSYNQTFFRMLGINMISKVILDFTSKKVYDTTSGFRAVNKEIISEFANNYPYDFPEPITTMQMISKGKEIKEISVEMNKRETGISSISPFKSIIYMIKVILALCINGILE